MTKSCIFCEIVSGRAASRTVYRDAHTVAFLDISPATHGHTLVVPIAHSSDIWDLPKATAGRLMEAVHEVAAILQSSLNPDGMTLFQANRSAGWQDVVHMHMHVVPRYNSDTLKRPWHPERATEDALDTTHALIQGAAK